MSEPLKVDIEVNREEVDDTIQELIEACDDRPNITIRNNSNVYITINNYEVEKEDITMKEE